MFDMPCYNNGRKILESRKKGACAFEAQTPFLRGVSILILCPPAKMQTPDIPQSSFRSP